ncbi:exosortase N [Flavitalea flava]
MQSPLSLNTHDRFLSARKGSRSSFEEAKHGTSEEAKNATKEEPCSLKETIDRSWGRGPLWRRWPVSCRLLCLLYFVLTLTAFRQYIDWRSVNFILGPLAVFLFPANRERSAYPYRYAFAAAVFFLLFLLLPVKTFLYMAMAASIFFFRESFYGKIDRCIVFAVLLSSPIMDYFVNLFSFPIRLQLTTLAGSLLQHCGIPVVAEGNLLIYQGNEFTIDPACMGLHMLIASLLAGILLIRHYQAKSHRILGTLPILLLLLGITVLNIFANLVRIICLTVFCILPENPMHSLSGIICLILYVLIPMIPVCRALAKRLGKPDKKNRKFSGREKIMGKPYRILSINLLIACSMLTGVIISLVKDHRQQVAATTLTGGSLVGGSLPGGSGYSVERLAGQTLKLTNGLSLIYVKPIPDFYYTDHLPTICWQGGGYDFHQVKEEIIGGQMVYSGLLNKNKEILYTAWWYDNGQLRTRAQLEWRWDVLRGGAKYSLINVTSACRSDLEKEIARILTTGDLRQYIREGQ